MIQIRKLLTGTALSMFTAAAFAQTAAPAAAGVDTPQAAPGVGLQGATPAPQNLTAPSPTDPLVQKRNADAQASADYHQSKKAAKSQYKDHVKDAKTNRKADRQAANEEMKEQMQGTPAQSQGGNPQP
ncbi:hypothetical protein [Paraburkholderia caballeronis]|uniref:hypothetical protein n=1 Tax=Paraburkholderia caballeronis TaxID=416943 RepID=UPI001064E167|nr:hypothetical protein [Paraburkholderia caballeronis]TDV16152.1 hypothetical protein C7406_1084 [Paraburkholderia caballeronis]TDV20502.1 hypothetical protein C7408_1014 [Paraburkholderia caballeronis]TDV32970.1 hypothetical protein C7404_101100 [Paraburkholderia caballeronis]TDV38443.1 hypothetical protein C7405_102658 [Paraburkholderia caballeronis]